MFKIFHPSRKRLLAEIETSLLETERAAISHRESSALQAALATHAEARAKRLRKDIATMRQTMAAERAAMPTMNR